MRTAIAIAIVRTSTPCLPSKETVLVLRTCSANMRTYGGGFVWPSTGPVEAPDWDPEPRCGGGLHGFLWGEGHGGLADWSEGAKWLVVEVAAKEVVDLGGKVKFSRGRVVHCGDRASATALIASVRPGAIVGGKSTSGDYGTSTSGDCGNSTSGDYGKSTSGDYGTSTSGDCGTSISGADGNSTSGDCGTSASGTGGISVSGDYGTSISGADGTSISGDRGIIIVRWRDEEARRDRLVVGYVGEDGIEPGVPYRADKNGKLVRADIP